MGTWARRRIILWVRWTCFRIIKDERRIWDSELQRGDLNLHVAFNTYLNQLFRTKNLHKIPLNISAVYGFTWLANSITMYLLALDKIKLKLLPLKALSMSLRHSWHKAKGDLIKIWRGARFNEKIKKYADLDWNHSELKTQVALGPSTPSKTYLN